MHRKADQVDPDQGFYHGVRMTADAYFKLGETDQRYELIDGVVCMSPSASALHQRIIARIAAEIIAYLNENPVGEVYVEADVLFGPGPSGGDLVYRPDVTFLGSDKAAGVDDRIDVVPDVVVEIISPSSRRCDTETKRSDYQRFGVAEYWIIDPIETSMTFLRLQQARYAEVAPQDDSFSSEAIPGFDLDLPNMRRRLTQHRR